MENIVDTYHKFVGLVTAYPKPEAKSITFLLFEHFYGFTKNEIITGSDIEITFPSDLLVRVNSHEPPQYIIGHTWFCDIKFNVSPAVLIPRPETEELVLDCLAFRPGSVLDLCTGSGCIAISIGSKLPLAEIYAVDISSQALAIAKENARINEVRVSFVEKDLLKTFEIPKCFDLIVSNPPYVLENEKKGIQSNVLNHEPHLALFVPDNDPLLFYRKILKIAIDHLNKNGKLAMEINTALGAEVVDLFLSGGFKNVVCKKDFFGKDRFVFAERN